jgi:hypothetical protein
VTPLDRFLTPFQWGAADCCTTACDAFCDRWGVDPMAPWRGRYTGPVSALRLVRARGGWLPACDWLAETAGLHRAGHADGALALIRNGRDCVLAFGVASGWMVRTDEGVAILPPGCEVAAWQR